jgi:dinuclear metal center YbgI/SA1388 family protein
VAVVKDIIDMMESIAPQQLAEGWDNSGLQCGDLNWPVNHIVVALDPSPSVVKAACDKKADLLITHHPLLFSPLKKIVLNSPVGKIIHASVCQKLAIFTAHTNLDSVCGGLNDVFAEKIGLKNLRLLASADSSDEYKLVVYVPAKSSQQVLNAVLETKAGIIDTYTCCTFRHNGIGTFKPGDESNPAIGKANKINEVDEVKIETRVSKKHLNKVIDHIRHHHPYETMAYDIYPLFDIEHDNGIGRIGELESPMSLGELSGELKKRFQLNTLKVAGSLDMRVKKAAICTGSGSSLMKQFFASDADVFISGDLKFHDARDAESQSRGLIDIGHFASEELMIGMIKERLFKIIKGKGLNVAVEAMRQEEDPYLYL